MSHRALSVCLLLVVVLLVAASLAGWLGIFFNRPDGAKSTQDDMLVEVSKSLGQLFFVTLLGGAVAFLYTQYAKEREARTARLAEDNRLRRELLASLIKVRGRVEAARRKYKLLTKEEQTERRSVVVAQLLAARLRLSGVWHDVETYKGLFPGTDKDISRSLTYMKMYLDRIIKEHETTDTTLDDSPAAQEDQEGQEAQEFEDAKFDTFDTFVKAGKRSAYEADFLDTYYRGAAKAIRANLVAPQG